MRKTVETVETIWTLPTGKQVRTANAVCPDCEHAHEAALGGICVGCPCPNTPGAPEESK